MSKGTMSPGGNFPPKIDKCCCGKYELEDNEPFIMNDTVHEPIGKDNFCGSRKNHHIAHLEKEVVRLEEENDRLREEIQKHKEDTTCSG